MRNLTTNFIVLLLFFCFSAFQDKPSLYSQQQINAFVKEVFQDQADALVFTAKSKRLEMITDFLQRVHFESDEKFKMKKIPLLSACSLQNKYNPNLKRDIIFDPKTFNPLKYNLPMSAKSRTVVRVDDAKTVIIIEPAN